MYQDFLIWLLKVDQQGRVLQSFSSYLIRTGHQKHQNMWQLDLSPVASYWV